jgi:ATP-dependent Clp protease ATP-binding subunit ClpA
MWKYFTEEAREAIYYAEQASTAEHSTSVEAHHLLIGVLTVNDEEVNRLLLHFSSNEKLIRECLRNRVGPPFTAETQGEKSLSFQGKRVIDKMYDEARLFKSTKMIKPIFILLALIEGDHLAGEVLHELGFDIVGARDFVRLNQYLG